MKILLIQVLAFSLFFLILFALTFNLDFTSSILLFLQDNTFLSACTSIFVLGADILLPVPSSVVMLLNGKLFGIISGTIISCAGLMLSTFAGYFIGKKITTRLSYFINPKQQAESEQLFQNWGLIILIVSRPIPLLSESISIVAGMQRMSFSTVFFSSLAGSLPGSFIYAYYGAFSNTEQNQYLSFLLVVAIASLAFIVSRLLKTLFNKKHYELL